MNKLRDYEGLVLRYWDIHCDIEINISNKNIKEVLNQVNLEILNELKKTIIMHKSS